MELNWPEEKCVQHGRYLMARDCLTGSAIGSWKELCRNRCPARLRDASYERFMQWEPQYNELAVITMYAYADQPVPRKFDMVFDIQRPESHVAIQYEVIHSVWEGWYPIDRVEHGHKHIVVLRFQDKIPEILRSMRLVEPPFPAPSEADNWIGFCNSGDFPAIRQRCEKVQQLRQQFGTSWFEHDEEQF